MKSPDYIIACFALKTVRFAMFCMMMLGRLYKLVKMSAFSLYSLNIHEKNEQIKKLTIIFIMISFEIL